MSLLPEETRRDRNGGWEQNPPPASSRAPSRAAAALAVPELARALEPYVNQAAHDLARIGPVSGASESPLASARNTEAHDHPAVDDRATKRAQVDRLDAVRPRLFEPESLFPRAEFGTGGSKTATVQSHPSGRSETSWPHDVASGPDAVDRLSLSQWPLGDSRAFEGRSDGAQGLDGAGAGTIAELANRLLQAALRLEHLAERYTSEPPRPYRSTPRPFRDRVEG